MIQEFTYHRPRSLEEVGSYLSAARDPFLLAGGMTLVPILKQRLTRCSDLIDLSEVEELRGIRVQADGLEIGAMTSHAGVAGDPQVRSTIPALAQLANAIGDPQVRNRGTLGGSVATNDPVADYPACLLGLGATIVTERRRILADDFFTGGFESALEPAEVVTAVSFPRPHQAAYAKFPQPASRFALVGVFVARRPAGVRVAVAGAASQAFRALQMEAALSNDFSPDALSEISIDSEGLIADIHASADYRAHLITVMAKRAVAAAID